MTTEYLIVRALERGLLLSDFEQLTIGFLLGIIATQNELYEKDKQKEDVRTATQADFDSF